MGEEDSEPKRSRGLCGWFLALLVLGAVAAAIAVGVKVKMDHHHHSAPKLGPAPGPPGPVVKMYGDALTLAMQFFQVQQCNFLIPLVSPLFVLLHSIRRYVLLLHFRSVACEFHQIDFLMIGYIEKIMSVLEYSNHIIS